MAGIYLHIPFCRQACFYCDFHFSTNINCKAPLLRALRDEITLRKNYLGDATIETIYFGGGTPSILSEKEVSRLLGHIKDTFHCSSNLEISLEANPEDLNLEKLKHLHSSGINRLSIGVQSFNNKTLEFLNRGHTSQQSLSSINNARKAGFSQLNIDLMYGVAKVSLDNWQKDLDIAIKLRAKHISAYCLNIEKNTVFGYQKQKGSFTSATDDQISQQFEMLVSSLEENGYIHYELSNFCLPSQQSKHNTNYWRNIPYLGIGPSAHSYNILSRSYNVSDNKQYIKSLKKGKLPYKVESLTPQDKINEYITTSLATMWGCDLNYLLKSYNYDLYQKSKNDIYLFINQGLIIKQKSTLLLTRKGKLLFDSIASTLFTI